LHFPVIIAPKCEVTTGLATPAHSPVIIAPKCEVAAGLATPAHFPVITGKNTPAKPEGYIVGRPSV
jgi:hypothetical protein